jgi:hypothetical protein
MKFAIFFLLFLGSIFSAHAQLVNIESARMQTDSVRFALKDEFVFGYNDNNGLTIFQIKNNLVTQVKTKSLKDIFLLIGNYRLIRSASVDFQNIWLGHLRYNREITELFRVEAFAQIQQNRPLLIQRRILFGAGPRLKFISKDNARFYYGLAYMYELEESTLGARSEHNRISTYLSFSLNDKKDKISLTNTAYYQPDILNFSDFRILDQLRFEYAITKNIGISSSLTYYLDSEPPSLMDNQYSFENDIGLTFNF